MQRAAMLAAAFILDEAREHELADLLHLARPDAARRVATGVAVHALLRGVSAAWDIFAVLDAFDHDQAAAWHDDAAPFFEWWAEPDDLLPVEAPAGERARA